MTGSTPFPVGTVTFLLADIAGSSRLWEHEPEHAATCVARFYEILHEAIGRRGGALPVEQGEGDSVVGVFARASAALAAAAAAQVQLGSESWPTSQPLRVRIAVHTGDARLRDEANYAGQALNRCARLRELAHGGQTLVSRTTHDIAADELPRDIALADLGVHRLRDLGRPEQVYALQHPRLQRDFPKLRSVDATPNNLPPQLTSFIGRRREADDLRRLLQHERLVTLTGAGGCGKTRLSLQVAAAVLDEFADGVWWVDLAAIGDPGLVANAVGAAMGIREAAGEAFTATLVRALYSRNDLLVLDNCEHVIEACAALCHTLLRGCPRLVVLATSREPLQAEGEVTMRVPSLAIPQAPTMHEAARSEATQLFVDRACKARPGFVLTEADLPAVAQICQRLDGIPLAIELAAARIRAMSPAGIAAGLDDRFRLLASGRRTATPRHQTLEASITWSYELLTAEQRMLIRRLSVFAGGFGLDAARAICAGDGLASPRVLEVLVELVDRSLVDMRETGPRYRLLETIRQYAAQRLTEAGEADPFYRRHLDHYTRFAEDTGPLVEWGSTLDALGWIDTELGNLRAALDRASVHSLTDTGLRLATACTLYWIMRAHVTEARARVESLLAQSDPSPRVRAQALVSLEWLAFVATDFDAAHTYGEDALSAARELGDRALEGRALAFRGAMQVFADPQSAAGTLEAATTVSTQAGDEFCASWALLYSGANRMLVGDLPSAIAMLDRASDDARRAAALFNLAASLLWRGGSHFLCGHMAQAERDLSEAREVAASTHDDLWGRLIAEVLGEVVSARGDHVAGRALIEEGLRDVRETGNMFPLVNGLFCLAFAARAAGDAEATEAAALQAAEIYRAMGARGWLGQSLALAAWARMSGGDEQAAERLLDEALADAAGLPAAGVVLTSRGLLARRQGDPIRAEELARRCLSEVGADNLASADALELLAGALVGLREHTKAAHMFGAAQRLRDDRGNVRWTADETAYRADVEALRAAIGEEAFAHAWAQGAALALDEAVANATRGRGTRRRPASGWDSLTPTELQVVRLVAEGLTNPQVGQRLFISPGTVKTHLSHVFAKLGVSTRAELATLAARHQS